MPPELSRADLLRVLARASDVPPEPLARLLGWGHAAASEPVEVRSTQSPTRGASIPRRYLVRPKPCYWHLAGCIALAGEPGSDSRDAPTPPDESSLIDARQTSPPDSRIPPLLSPAQWQNLWDRLPPSLRRGRAIDLPASLRRLTRAEPLRDLPRLPRRGFNRAVTLILDRPEALRPVWDDMRLAKRSLAALLGDALQTFLLPAGPDGPWLTWHDAPPRECVVDPSDSENLPDRISHDALVVMIGAFGALDSAEIAPNWRGLLRRLREAGHAVLLVPVCPLRQTTLPVAALDPTQDWTERDIATQALETLLAALSQTWLPTPARLRQLRQAIPGSNLDTELRAYNAPDVERDDVHLWLIPDRLPVWLACFAGLPESRRAALQRVIQDWRKGLDATAQAIERLQATLLDPGSPEAYPALQQQAAAVAATLDGPSSMARAQLASLLPLRPLLASCSDLGWRSVLRDLDRLGRSIGLASVDAPEGIDGDVPSHILVQRGADLQVRPGTEGLFAIGARAYSLETGRLLDGAALGGKRSLTIIDRGCRRRLATLTRPSWADRIWCDGRDLFAAHADNAILRWWSAAPTRPEGAWRPEHNPWPWATEIGADRFGLWAELWLKEVPYRLRWVPAGRFLMGSPKDEPGRADDETQHEVTLTRGFWLGETVVTQALWHAVMGDNPSNFKGDDLPVECVSWNDCQEWIARANRLREDGLVLRLPTEAEWEFACRAGTLTAFSFGDALDTGRANYNGNYPY